MNDTIWTYWEGPQTPLVKLCLDSLEIWNRGKVKVLGPDDLPKEILQETEGLPSLAFRADLVRTWILLDQGGVWVDADTVAVRPLSLLEKAQDLDLFGIHNKHQKKGWGTHGISATPYGGRAGTPIMEEIHREVLEVIRRMKKGQKVRYGLSSVGTLSQIWRRHQESPRVERFPHWRWTPVPWYRAAEAFPVMAKPYAHETGPWWNPNAELYHLTNVATNRWKEASRQQLLQGSSFLAFIIQKAYTRRPAMFGRAMELLKRIPLGQPIQGTEVGVFQAMNARQLLQQRPELHLNLVDLWGVHPAGGSYVKTRDYQAQFDAARWERIWTQVVPGHLKPYPDRYRLIRKDSLAAASEIPDASQDFVFIDGDHSYDGVKRDVFAWWPKVKPGGFLSGHDYNHPREGARGYGVNKAVHELADHLGGLQVTSGQDLFWMIERKN